MFKHFFLVCDANRIHIMKDSTSFPQNNSGKKAFCEFDKVLQNVQHIR